MALKPDRVQDPYGSDIEWTFTTLAERGGIASVDVTNSAGASGGYPGDPRKIAKYVANPSGAVPLGILLMDVVTFDTNRQHENFQKSGFQTLVNRKVALDRGGRFTTNMIPSGVTVAAGQSAILAASGMISNVQPSGNGAPVLGTWLSAQDADGYAKIQLQLR